MPVRLSSDPRTAAFDLGAGKPVLLLHGFTGTPFEVRPVGEALARRGYHARAPRLAGHADTAEALGQTTAASWFASARDALDGLAPEGPAHLVGLSMGAMLCLLLAREKPAQVASLTLMAPAARFRGQIRVFFNAFRYAPLVRLVPFFPKNGVGLVDQAMAATVPSLDRVPTRLSVEVLRLLSEARQAASQVHVPSLVLYGEQDRTVSRRAIAELVASLQPPPSRVVALSGSGHLLPLDVERERVAEEVGDFIAGCDALRG